MTRTPHADRPEVRAEFCTCERDGEGEIVRSYLITRDDLGRVTSKKWITDYNLYCKLHGWDVQPSPF